MSDRNKKHLGIFQAIGTGLGYVLLAFLAILVLAMFGLEGLVQVPFEILWHLVTGFVRFFLLNLGLISSDAGTWGPGLAAFLLGVVVIHWFGRSWSRHRQKQWKVSASLALGMLLPLMFAISFLVPGTILQIWSLKQTKWFQSNWSDRAPKEVYAGNIAQAAHAWATTKGGDRFPSSTAALISPDFLDERSFRPEPDDDGPGEPPLYLGAGLTLESDPALPLVISATYRSKKGTNHRTVITIGNEFVEIRDDELDAWIDKAIAARNGVKP